MGRDAQPQRTDHNSRWHTCSVEATRLALTTSEQGLTEEVAARRLLEVGPNRLASPRKRGPVIRFFAQFQNILLYIMMVAAVVTAMFGHWVDTAVLATAIIVNAIIGFIQEGRAESALDSIRNMLLVRATVIRGGRRIELDANGLVPGDLIVLNAGDRVPADVRLVRVKNLKIDEAALTGESVPVEKGTDAAQADAPLGDRYGMVYAGTLVVNGQATGWVVGTATDTELGHINQMLASIGKAGTPMMRQINFFSYVLAFVIIAIAALVFLFGTLVRGEPLIHMLMLVVALVAAAIPEGLPAIMTVTLALGVQRMARQHAIIRHLPAVETLGSVTVICSDKTGTLTRNEMSVQRIVLLQHVIDVEGVGYEPSGRLLCGGRPVSAEQHSALDRPLTVGVLCNDATLHLEVDQWRVEGDPTEGALLVLGRKAGISEVDRVARWPRIDSIPFESENRYMATHHLDAQKHSWIFVKGAPERILEMCAFQAYEDALQPIDPDYWRRQANDVAARGLRVLALAQKQADPQGLCLSSDDMRKDFVLLALVGMIDSPREEAIEAVADCHRAGIQVKMITGDHVDTAMAVGAQLGIGRGKPAITGAEIALVDDAGLQRIVSEVSVFARASPEHKLRLVRALQRQGQVVAMTGDGVNDAPALKSADVGVAMGRKGTEVAKEAADVVLANDNFATITVAVREGRTVYDNIKKFILFMLPTNGGEVLIVITALVLGSALPLTPAQVLWINMVTVSTLGLALAFEPSEQDVMRRPPRLPTEKLLTGFFVWRVIFVSILMATGALSLFFLELTSGRDTLTASTLAVNAVVFSEMFYLINSRRIHASILNRDGLLGSPHCLVAILFCILLQMVFTYVPLMQTLFSSVALVWVDWLKVLGVGIMVFLIAELEKWIFQRFFKRTC